MDSFDFIGVLFFLTPFFLLIPVIYYINVEIKYKEEKNKIEKFESNNIVGSIENIQIESNKNMICSVLVDDKTILCPIDISNLKSKYYLYEDNNLYCRLNLGGRNNGYYKISVTIGTEVKVGYDGENYISDIKLKIMQEEKNRILLRIILDIVCFLIILLAFISIK